MLRTVLLFVLTAALAPFGVAAQSISGAIQNTASLPAECHVQAVSHINFGIFSPLSSQLPTATGSMRVQCTQGVTLRVRLNNSVEPAPCYNGRQMRRGGSSQVIPYQIYSDAAMTQVFYPYTSQTGATGWNTCSFPWSGTILQTQGYAYEYDAGEFTSSTTPKTVSYYAKMDRNSNVSAGTYSDQLVQVLVF